MKILHDPDDSMWMKCLQLNEFYVNHMDFCGFSIQI